MSLDISLKVIAEILVEDVMDKEDCILSTTPEEVPCDEHCSCWADAMRAAEKVGNYLMKREVQCL